MMSGAPLTRIAIIGGGTAGWMSAALLSKLFMGAYDITLVESDEIGTIGVGEATIPAIRNYCNLAGIDQAQMIRATQATFKLGIEFDGWRRPGHSYIHGFGKIGQDLFWLHPHHLWQAERAQAAGSVKPFDHYSLNCLAARQNRFCLPDPTNPGSPMADLDYAYHFDASLFARFLRAESEKRGVRRVEGRITDVALHPETGHVQSVKLARGDSIAADLFVDCSGMQGLLIGQALGVGYESWSHWLPCDRALAVPSPRLSPLPPYTRATARDAGWQWRIPLQHRTGNGHVYASAFSDDQAAADLLLAHLEGGALAEPKPVRFTPGRRHSAWERNVVAIGLSAGFLEPLESTSIHLIQTAILRLVALFPNARFAPADRAEYNRQTRFEYEDVRDFIIAHYKVTEREDTPFWAHVRNMPIPDSLAERLELFRTSGRFFLRAQAELFREESWVQVLIGQGLAMGHDPFVSRLPPGQAGAFLRDIEDVIADCARAMPDHAAFIARHCAAPPMRVG